MSKTLSKTFRLRRQSVDALDALVRAGRAESQTALVEMLIAREKCRFDMEQEERELDQAWSEAMKSAEYASEMNRIEAEFATADAESASQIL